METCNCENPKDMIHKAMVKIFDDLESEYTNKAQVSKPPLINTGGVASSLQSYRTKTFIAMANTLAQSTKSHCHYTENVHQYPGGGLRKHHRGNLKGNCNGNFFFFFFQVQPYNRKYRSIGHRVWSKSLSILTELSVNSKSTIALNPWHTHSQ